MKKVMLFAVLSFFMTANAQTKNDSTEMAQLVNDKIVISNVEKVDNKTSSELYKSALMWATDNFIADRTEYLVKDAEAGILVINGVEKTWDNHKFKLTIQTKENRYKWEISEIYIDWKSRSLAEMFNKPMEEEFKDSSSKEKDVFIYFKKMIQNLEKSMSTKESW